MVISASSSPTVACHPTYNFRLQSIETVNALVVEILPLFPLEHTRTFVATELDLVENGWCAVLRKMKGLSHLQLDCLDIGPVMGALGLDDRGAHRRPLWPHQIPHMHTDKPYPPVALKLQSLSLNNLNVLSGRYQKLFNVLEQRSNNHIGLKILVVDTCRVPTVEDFEGLAEEITWEGVTEMGSDYGGSELDGPDDLIE